MTIRTKSLGLAVFAFAIGLCAQAQAQQTTDMSTPYGQSAGDFARPYQTNRRDPQGTRIVVNGRIIDAGESRSAPKSGVQTHQPGATLSSKRMGGPTLNAFSIGNSVSINNVRNSVITIDQRNYGQQTVAPGRGS